jgi:hypothetical protein
LVFLSTRMDIGALGVWAFSGAANSVHLPLKGGGRRASAGHHQSAHFVAYAKGAFPRRLRRGAAFGHA